MRMSLRSLLRYVACAGVVLAIARAPVLVGGALLIAAVTATNFLVPTRIWRHGV